MLMGCPSQAQTTAVSATITDSDGQTWNNGTFTVIFIPKAGAPGPYIYNGSPMTNAQKGPYMGTMNGSGSMSVSLPDNSFITPSGSQWQFTLCPNSSGGCSQVTTAVSGATFNATTLFSTNVTAPRFPATGPGQYGYSDVEVTTVPGPGGYYFQVGTNVLRFWNGSAFTTQPNSGGSNTWTGTNNFNILNAGTFNGQCNVGESVLGNIKYLNIAAAFADSNCHAIHLPDGYSETLSANITARGSVALIADGLATINMGGTNQLLLTVGGTTADNFTLKSNFPNSDHGGNGNSGFQITGYTGTSAPIVIGNGTNSGTRTLNLYISGVDINLASAGSGAVGIDVINTVQLRIEDVNCSMTGASQGCVLLDGTGLFTGVGELNRIICGGNTGGNQFCIRGQNLVTNVNVNGGSAELIGATSVCTDANQTEFNGNGFNCNSASTMITVEGASSRVSGSWRRDSGVTLVANFGVGTGNNQFYCPTCNFAPDGTQTVINSGASSNNIWTTSDQHSDQNWVRRCGGAASCGFFNMQTSKFDLLMNSGGEIDVIPENGGGGSGFRFNGNSFVNAVNGSVVFPEGNDPGCGANSDILHGDATDHALKLCNNNSAEGHVLATGSTDPKGIQTKRGVAGCTTGAAIGNACATDITVTWPVAFANTNYTVSCFGNTPTNSPTNPFLVSGSKLAGSIHVNYFTFTAVASSFATIECTAVYDGT